jgi:hypothetical protein
MTLAVAGLVSILVACGPSGGSPGSSDQPSSGGSASSAESSTPSSDATSTPAGSAGEACALLSDAEIADTTGYTVFSMAAGPVLGTFQNGCHWQLETATAGLYWDVDLGVQSPDGREYFDTFIGPYTPAVSGVGDAAASDDVGLFYVVVGNTMIAVSYSGLYDGADAVPQALAEIAITYLP